MERLALIIAEKLNKSPGSVHVLIPTKGWSEGDREGMPLYDLAIDRVFTETLKKSLKPRIPFEEMNVHINDPSFSRKAVNVLHAMIRQGHSPAKV
jgi:uncharacterized protein (UPF0261 family)